MGSRDKAIGLLWGVELEVTVENRIAELDIKPLSIEMRPWRGLLYKETQRKILNCRRDVKTTQEHLFRRRRHHHRHYSL